ncbi:polyprenyl synthetase family protein [Hyphococcus flavus]|uniref:Polyprenyl synthetase family protein n=1 Tax=Hyphococcus flavus TaxID=1866326 RepID=A0AAE9ZES7_9PROT|nr:polyprenyl synthetase family protein [Hyphococcus flavus]WDI31488.1 polyprenyl synthetase family protein [Hyphococcus flavus]
MDKLKVVHSAAAGPQNRQDQFDRQLAALREHLERRLAELFPNPASSELSAAISHGLLSPGKRLRPLITMLACKQCGGDPLEAIDAACAVEMVHAASLIVDDLPCMDNATLRRNGETTHVAFGEGVSILASITLVNEAFGVMARMQTADQRQRIAAIDKLAKAIGVNGLAGGQERDIARSGIGSGGSIKEIEQSHLEKTGALFAAAAGIGAVVAGARTVEIDAMENFGAALGLAYQTFDDVIDAQCSENQTGKNANQDENRTTVVTMLGQEQANKSAGQWLSDAVKEAEKVDYGAGSPLTELAKLIELKFSKLTENR